MKKCLIVLGLSTLLCFSLSAITFADGVVATDCHLAGNAKCDVNY